MALLETRNLYKLTQLDAAKIVGVPVRTYLRYELDENYGDDFKRKTFVSLLNDKCEITEEKGILTIEEIKIKLTTLFETEYKDKVSLCILFGSYAKGKAKGNSDVDLYVSTSLTGMHFVGLIESIRETLRKKIDLIRDSELENNIVLIKEILKDEIKIYESSKWQNLLGKRTIRYKYNYILYIWINLWGIHKRWQNLF